MCELSQNAHKWLFSHRGSSLFYVPKRNQHFIRSSFPTSAGYWSKKYPALARVDGWRFVEQVRFSLSFLTGCLDGSIVVLQFDWTGTLDYTVWENSPTSVSLMQIDATLSSFFYQVFYSILPAVEFRKFLGGEAVIQKYCHALALKCVSPYLLLL